MNIGTHSSSKTRPTLVLVGHSKAITSLAFASDGNTLLSGSYDKTVILWNVQVEQIQRLFRTADYVQGVAFSSDGTNIVSSGGQVWNAASGRLQRKFGKIHAPLALSPDGKRLAGMALSPIGEGWIIRVASLHTGRMQHIVSWEGNDPRTLAFSSDGRLVAVAAHAHTPGKQPLYAVTLYDLQTRAVRLIKFEGNVRLFGVALSSHTRLIAIILNPTSICDAETGEWLQTLEHRREVEVFEVALSSDGQLLAVGYSDGVIALHNVTTGALLWETQAHQGWVRALAFTTDKRTLASAGNDKIIHLWNVSRGTLERSLPGRTGEIWRVAFAPQEATLLTEGADGQVRCWNLHSGALQQTLRGHINDDGNVVLLKAEEQTVWLTGEARQRERNHYGVGRDKDHTTARLSRGTIMLRRGDWSRALDTREIEPERLIDFALSPDGRLLATGHAFGAKGVHVWDVETGQHIETINTCDDPLALAFSQDGETLAIGTAYNEDIALVSLKRAGSGRKMTGHTDSLRCLSYSPDGKWLASGAADNTVKLWSTARKCLCMTLLALPHDEWIAYTPEGYYHGSPHAEEYLRWQVEDDLLDSHIYAAMFRQQKKVQSALQG